VNIDNLSDEDGSLPPITHEGREYMNPLLDRNFNTLTWVASETQKHSVTGSLQHPLPATKRLPGNVVGHLENCDKCIAFDVESEYEDELAFKTRGV